VVSASVLPATVKLSKLMFTVSLLSAQMPLEIVHTKLYEPGCRFAIVDVGFKTSAIVAVVGPDICDHTPVPSVGTFALS